MAWKRCIPFGYAMEQATIVREKAEAEAVRRIFAQYLAGNSFKQIAEGMTRQGLRYHREKPQWDKSMVKRILENQRYLGDDNYPQIISEEEYQRVQWLKEAKTVFSPCSERISEVQGKLTCASCGSAMIRCSKGKDRVSWKCKNPDCGEKVFIRDAELEKRLDRCFSVIARKPDVLEIENSQTATESLSVLRMENELRAAFNRGPEMAGRIKELILSLAAERYNDLPNEGLIRQSRELRQELEQEGLSESLRHKITDILISTISIERSRGICLRLVNGITISDEEGEE